MNKTRDQILNEAFIGKKPTDKLFGHWKDLTDFIKSHPHDPHLKEKCYLDFKKELSSLFGFDRTELVVIPTADINAMTLPIRFDDEDLQTLTDLFLVNDKIGNTWSVKHLDAREEDDTYNIGTIIVK